MLKEKLNIILELTKVRITVLVTVTTVFGYVLAAGTISTAIILPALGIFLLACGSAVINHYQEWKTDSLMARTRNRPIPAGKITVRDALLLAISISIIGSGFLYFSSGLTTLLLGWLAFFWYNGVYTPLKKKSSLAVIPGSLIGAIPPVVGWVAGGGELLDPKIGVIAFFFFIWQVPHFWLLLLALGKDYERAGFPTLTKVFSREQLIRLTFIWTAVTALTVLLFPVYEIIKTSYTGYILLVLALWLIIASSKLLNLKSDNYSFAFKSINLFVLIVIIVVSIDKLLIIV